MVRATHNTIVSATRIKMRLLLLKTNYCLYLCCLEFGFLIMHVQECTSIVYISITYTIAHTCMLRVCIAQNESALPLQHWTRINKPINHSVECPEERCDHATTCVSGPLLVIVGGASGRGIISDCWIVDLITKQWKKV